MPLVHAAGSIRVIPLGAGQDVGRSCVLVMMGGKTIMFDCGMHMGYNDSRRFPDFSVVAAEGPLTPHIDCAIISHFHLDHCGALPYFSEMRGYDGPIYMTYPTKVLLLPLSFCPPALHILTSSFIDPYFSSLLPPLRQYVLYCWKTIAKSPWRNGEEAVQEAAVAIVATKKPLWRGFSPHK